VQYLRPIRGLLPKETVLFCRQQGIPFASPPTFYGYGGPWRSLNTVLESFMVQLMIQFPSTPFNVLNSVTKLAPAASASIPAASETASVASSASTNQPKVIMTKASRQNYLDCLSSMQEAVGTLVASQHGNPGASITRTRCVSCGVELPTESKEAALHTTLLDEHRFASEDASLASLVKECEDAHGVTGGDFCLGCRVVWRAVMRGENTGTSNETEAYLKDMTHFAALHHSQMAKSYWRKMTSTEVAADIKEFLLPQDES